MVTIILDMCIHIHFGYVYQFCICTCVFVYLCILHMLCCTFNLSSGDENSFIVRGCVISGVGLCRVHQTSHLVSDVFLRYCEMYFSDIVNFISQILSF